MHATVALGSAGIRELFEICNEIYIRGEWSEDFLESIIILSKRRVERKNVLISLVSHASKIVLKKDINSKIGKQSRVVSRKGSVWFQERLWHKRCYCSNERVM